MESPPPLAALPLPPAPPLPPLSLLQPASAPSTTTTAIAIVAFMSRFSRCFSLAKRDDTIDASGAGAQRAPAGGGRGVCNDGWRAAPSEPPHASRSRAQPAPPVRVGGRPRARPRPASLACRRVALARGGRRRAGPLSAPQRGRRALARGHPRAGRDLALPPAPHRPRLS